MKIKTCSNGYCINTARLRVARARSLNTWSRSARGIEGSIPALTQRRKSLRMGVTTEQVETSAGQTEPALPCNQINNGPGRSMCARSDSVRVDSSSVFQCGPAIAGALPMPPTASLPSLTLSQWFVFPNCASSHLFVKCLDKCGHCFIFFTFCASSESFLKALNHFHHGSASSCLKSLFGYMLIHHRSLCSPHGSGIMFTLGFNLLLVADSSVPLPTPGAHPCSSCLYSPSGRA